jgi:WD40 repeat protein
MRKLFYKEVPSWLYQLPKVKETWGAQIQILEDHSDSVRSVAFSPNGQLLASGSSDKTVKLWDPITGELQQTLEGHSSSVIAVALSPDGKLVASGSNDKTI